MKAAEIINMRHGWKQPQEIRNMRCQELAECCEDTLRNMQEFSFDRYFGLLRTRGYEVKPRYDRKGKLVGYTVGKNASVFKASEIGRRFMVSKLEATWQKLHPKPTQVKMNFSSPSVASSARTARPTVQTSPSTQPRVVVGHHPQAELSKPQNPTYSDYTLSGLATRPSGFLSPMRSRTFLRTASRYPKATRRQPCRISPMWRCCSSLATSMRQRPCQNHVAEAVIPPNLVGAGRKMRTIGSLPTVVYRWLTLCASRSHAHAVSTDKQTSL